MDHIIGLGTRSVSRTIAVTSELLAGRRGKDGSDARTEHRNVGEHDESSSDDDLTEQAWELDDVAEQIGDEDKGESDGENNDATNVSSASLSPLPTPVVLPQRRPRKQTRGFIRAYAPILGQCKGITQSTFVDFIRTWNAESQASPVFDVINVACLAVGFVPGHIGTAVSTVVGTFSIIAQETQRRYRTNKTLERYNEDLFKPRGLLAMVMAYKPDESNDPILQADISDPTRVALSKVLDPSQANKLKQVLWKFRDASGVSHGDQEMPRSATLVYPDLDRALVSKSVTHSAALKEHRAVVQDYLDRRAQADFAASHPNSHLAAALPAQNKQFVNRFCDPDHPVNNGSIFALVSGGTFDPIGAGRIRRAEAKAKKNGEPPLTEAERHDALMGRKTRGRVTGTPSKNIPVLGKMLKEEILYLVIVNLPSAGAIATVREMIEVA